MTLLRVICISLSVFLLAACASLPPQGDEVALVVHDHYVEAYVQREDGARQFTRTWMPAEGPVKGNIILLHGTSFHGGIYAPVAQRLTAVGYQVLAPDMRSWGRSAGERSFGSVDGVAVYLDDVMADVALLKRQYPDLPIYIMGESLGGIVAIYAALRHPQAFAGVITSAAAYQPNIELLGIRAPGFINAMVLTSAKWTGQLLPAVPALYSDMGIKMAIDDQVIERDLLADPYVCHGFLPAVYNSTLLGAGDYIEAHVSEFTAPILLLHGTGDVLVPVSSSEALYSAMNSQMKRIEVYDSPHPVLIERASVQAVSDVIDFLERVQRDRVASVGYPQ